MSSAAALKDGSEPGSGVFRGVHRPRHARALLPARLERDPSRLHAETNRRNRLPARWPPARVVRGSYRGGLPRVRAWSRGLAARSAPCVPVYRTPTGSQPGSRISPIGSPGRDLPGNPVNRLTTRQGYDPFPLGRRGSRPYRSSRPSTLASSSLMAAPSAASAHRSLPEKAGMAGENWHRPKTGRFRRRIAAIHILVAIREP